MACGSSWLNSYYQSPDWVKAMWVIGLPAFVVALTALGLWFFLSLKRLRLEERRMGLHADLRPALATPMQPVVIDGTEEPGRDD